MLSLPYILLSPTKIWLFCLAIICVFVILVDPASQLLHVQPRWKTFNSLVYIQMLFNRDG